MFWTIIGIFLLILALVSLGLTVLLAMLRCIITPFLPKGGKKDESP